jgi:hypothetical protein
MVVVQVQGPPFPPFITQSSVLYNRHLSSSFRAYPRPLSAAIMGESLMNQVFGDIPHVFRERHS